jgi:hypothetical protein
MFGRTPKGVKHRPRGVIADPFYLWDVRVGGPFISGI